MESNKSQKSYDYIHDYDKQKYKKILLRIREDDRQVIDKLESVESKNGYIIELIRKDLVK